MKDPDVLKVRKLEKELFRAWYNWLLEPPMQPTQEDIFK